MEVFNAYSKYYDLLYKDKDYKGEVDYIVDLIQSVAPNSHSILDLGCGTGIHDFYFAEKGYQVDGIDLSNSMIDIANEKLKMEYLQWAERLSFKVGDIRTIETKKKYDVVVSLFHVMSYQNLNKDLMDAFNTARKHLKQGGVFIYDFWYGPGVLNDPPVTRVKRLEDSEIFVTRIAEPKVHTERNVVDVNYTILMKNKLLGTFEELKEKHEMRYLFLPELDLFADKCGFSSLANYAWMSKESPQIDTWNAVKILRLDN